MQTVLKARDLLSYDLERIWTIPDDDKKIIVEFDDGPLETTGSETIFSFYAWPYQRNFQKAPLLKSHHIGSTRLGKATFTQLSQRAMFDCHDAYGGTLDIEMLWKMFYVSLNDLYNHMTYRLERFVSTIHIYDFIDVVLHPKIKEIKANALPNQHSIDEAYRQIKAILLDPNELVGNAIAKAAKSGLVDINQILQCVGIRGYISDIDSHIFRNPIMYGYVEGIRSLHDKIIESRSAAKALMFTKDPLQDVEYFNRQLQLVCTTFKTVHAGDCQSPKYLRFSVRSADFDSVIGKYYLDETDKTIKRIKNTDRHLIGQELKLRSVLYCQHPDNHGCCAICYGDLFLSVPKHTNQGHISSTCLGEKVSQNVMSTKHLDGSSVVDGIELGDFEQQFIEIDPHNAHCLKLSENLIGKNVKIRVCGTEARDLSSLNYTNNISELHVTRVAQMVEVVFIVQDETGYKENIVPVSIGNRYGSFTHEMLYYIKGVGWSVTDKGDYEIDLKDWMADVPMFVLPMKHLSMSDHVAQVDKMIKDPAKVLKKKLKARTDDLPYVDFFFYELHKLVSTKIKLNIAHLEVITKAMMITSYANRDYDIPHDADSGELGYYASTMKNRCLASTMAYQDHVKVLLEPNSFIIKKRPKHPYGPLLLG